MAKIKTKADAVAALTAAGIAHDPSAKLADLKALLPKEGAVAASNVATPGAVVASAPAPTGKPTGKVDPERQAAWDAFLVEARKENPARFDAQKARGEFDSIPDSWQPVKPKVAAQ